MHQKDLPERWVKKLRTYIRDQLKEEREELRATDFRDTVKISFEDGSVALFSYAFYILDEKNGEVGVFTEHCGYHVFPLQGNTFELLEPKWTDE